MVACSSDSPNGFSGKQDAGETTNGSGEVFLGDEDGSAPASCASSPDNVEIPNNGCDDDADGKIDNAPACDTGLAISGDAMAFAKALGLCRSASANDKKWGVISASFSNGYGRTTAPNAAQHGIVPKFGNVIKPREGSSLGVLSTGYAREFDSPTGTGDFKKQVDPMQFTDGGFGIPDWTPGQLPPGFPKPAQGCKVDNKVYDTISVKLQIRVPANAKGLSFDFNFWSGEWPEYVCTAYNDGFIAYLKSEAFNKGNPGNISFDAQNNPVSVNNGFFDRCTPNTQTGCKGSPPVIKTAACPGGTGELQGTGFGGTPKQYCSKPSTAGGATGWLTSTAPVKPGEVITLEFIIWDTGDPNFDSSVLIDNLTWVPGEVQTVTERPR